VRTSIRTTLVAVLVVFAASSADAQFGYRYTSPEVRDAIRTAKLDQLLIPIMEEWGVQAWVTLTRDPCDDMTNVIWERDIQLDPIAEYIGAERVTVPAAFIFTTSGERIAIAEEGDASYIRETGIYREVLTYTYNRAQGHSGFGVLLGQTLRRLNPETIGLNFSEQEGVADGLTVGMKGIFDQAVGPELASRAVSAERVIISLWNRKVVQEVELITRSAVLSADLTDEALRAIEPGVTTARGLFDDIRRRMAELGLEPGWEEYWSPTVTVSEFRLGRPPADRVIERGDLVVVNSGFLVEGHMSDVNRMAYVLREGEGAPPPLIQKLFDTGLAAARAAVAAIRPGATGERVDAAARSLVVNAGFKEYGHATGHTTGVWVHGLGVILGPRWTAYGEKVAMPIHQGDVYAVEPSLSAHSDAHGGELRIHFQEMVIVEKDGARYLSEPVTELILIED
jgi:Xaa-Pro aminopeptidase